MEITLAGAVAQGYFALRALDAQLAVFDDAIRPRSESLAIARARLGAARNALELSTVRYESGYSAYLEVLDAQRTANGAELALVRNRLARLAFSVDLMKALGGGWRAAD